MVQIFGIILTALLVSASFVGCTRVDSPADTGAVTESTDDAAATDATEATDEAAPAEGSGDSK